tara:strand:- start:111215 stop:112495 length:1281 start_codon:yes stop_codon:yes gene_type:complete
MDNMITEKVNELIESEKFPQIGESHKKYVTESMLTNQIKFMQGMNESSEHSTQTGGVSNWDPVLIRMVRRAGPQLMAFDLAGVQPLSGPTGSIFAMRARYTSQTGAEALHDEANTAHSGAGTQAGDTSGFPADFFGTGDPSEGTSTGTGMSTNAAEELGTTAGDPWQEMTFSIERTDVSTKARKLKASFTHELRHDLKQIHNLDAESELANVLSTEIVAEQDRELLRTINTSAQIGAQDAATPGMFDLSADSDGRWLVEKFKGLMFQLELEANAIAISTRRGKANRVICSANVASALNMAGVLDYNPELASRLNVDVTSNTFAGILLGRYQVHVDPYATRDYITLGYKGQNAWDAGVYWCPYVPLEMVRATAEDSFQPRIGFQTRYGIKANPFVETQANGSAKAGKGLGQGENQYFRKFAVTNLKG